MPAENAHLAVTGLNLKLGSFSLDDVGLSCRQGEYHILMGPTGSGKSSLLKCILGLHAVRSGKIMLGGKDITRQIPEQRRMGYVPQNYSLFPHLDVEGNVRFGARARKIAGQEAVKIVDELCAMLGIEHIRKRRIRNLSGGEKQKVALARALAGRPGIILLDEPFSSIDEGAKRGLWFELKRIISDVGITAIHITHNLEEAYTLGERFSLIIDGRIVHAGDREEVWTRPANRSVARYLGYRNILKGTSAPNTDGSCVDLGHFRVVLGKKIPEGKETSLCIRQQDIRIIREGKPIKDSLSRNVFSGEIAAIFTTSDSCSIWFRIDGSPHHHDLEAKFPLNIRGRYALFKGKKIRVAFVEPSIIVFDPSGQA